MGRLRDWLTRTAGSGGRDALEVWSNESQVTRSSGEAQTEPPVDDADLPDLPQPDWTNEAPDSVPPWRRHDRALIDAARGAAAATGDVDPDGSAALARDLRRLADLHLDGALSANEFVAGVKARLAADPGRPSQS